MSSVPKEKRTLDEWLALITEARQSGLTDAEWCRRHDISRHTFGSAIKRLRRKACAIPQGNSCVDLTSSSNAVPVPKQDVVRVGVLGEERCYALDQTSPPPRPSPFVDGAPVEISLGDACIRIANHADPMVVAGIVSALRRRP